MTIDDAFWISAPGFWIALVASYLLGSILFGPLVARLLGLSDLRASGSGNVGMTNAMRLGGKKAGALTLAGDGLKGTAAVGIGYWLAPATSPPDAFMLAVVVGHIFPLWGGFKGGKGVATYLGALLVLSPVATITFAGVWLALAALTRYASLASLCAVLASVAVASFFFTNLFGIPVVVTLVLIFGKHCQNILRLLAGTESKIGMRA